MASQQSNSYGVRFSSLPCESLSTPPSSAGSSSTTKKARGKIRNLLLCRMSQKLKLDFNSLDQPVGANVNKLTREIGVIIRSSGDAPISSLKWEKISREKKEKMYRVRDKFEFEESPTKKQRIM